MHSQMKNEIDRWCKLFKSYDLQFNLERNVPDHIKNSPINNTLEKYIDINTRTLDYTENAIIIFNYVCILNVRNKFKISTDCFAENILKVYFEFIDRKLYECYSRVQTDFLYTNMETLRSLRFLEFNLSREFYREIFQNSQITELNSECDNEYMLIELPTQMEYQYTGQTKHNKLNYMNGRQDRLPNNNPSQFRFIKCEKVCKSIIKFIFYLNKNGILNGEGDEGIVRGQIKKTDITRVLKLPKTVETFIEEISYIMFKNQNLFASFQTIEDFRNTKWIKHNKTKFYF